MTVVPLPLEPLAERVRAEAERVRPGRATAAGAARVLYTVGVGAAVAANGVALGLRWAGAAVKLGWKDTREAQSSAR